MSKPFAETLGILKSNLRDGGKILLFHTGGQMLAPCDALLVVPRSVTARIQKLLTTVRQNSWLALEHRVGLVRTAPDQASARHCAARLAA